MIVLDSSTRSLTIVLAGAKNTNDAPFVASYYDEPIKPGFSMPTASATPSTTNGVTAVTIVPAQGLAPGWRRRLKSFNLNNADLAAITLSIGYVDGATTYVLYKITLQTLEQLVYEDGYGFEAVDSQGAIKSQAAATSSATSIADSKALSVSVNLSTTASTVTLNSTQISGASVQSFGSSNWSTVSVSNSTTASTLALESVQISGASVQSFGSSNWSTISSATSRVKSSFTW